jgi:hypothetical protein
MATIDPRLKLTVEQLKLLSAAAKEIDFEYPFDDKEEWGGETHRQILEAAQVAHEVAKELKEKAPW